MSIPCLPFLDGTAPIVFIVSALVAAVILFAGWKKNPSGRKVRRAGGDG